MPKGSSSIRLKDICSINNDCIRLPIIGGHDVGHRHPLPPVLFYKGEWETIGKFMHWLGKGMKCPNCDCMLERVGVFDDDLDDGFDGFQCPNCMTVVKIPSSVVE